MGTIVSIPFEFDEANHRYIVPGREVLATGDVLALNGLCDYSQIPTAILENARWRGEQVDNAIRFYEEGDLGLDEKGNPIMDDSILPYFEGYLRFKQDTGFVSTDRQLGIVYESVGEQLIGCTLDLVGMIRNRVHIIDIKATHPQSGKAKKQTHFKWGMQLTSYYRAYGREDANRTIVYLLKDGTYELTSFGTVLDDVDLWESMVMVAAAKLANGYKRPEK